MKKKSKDVLQSAPRAKHLHQIMTNKSSSAGKHKDKRKQPIPKSQFRDDELV